jgi:hypothetical protein
MHSDFFCRQAGQTASIPRADMSTKKRISGHVADLLFALALALFPIAHGAEPEHTMPVLSVVVRGQPSLSLDLPELKARDAVTVRVQDDAGTSVQYTGISLTGLLASAGVEFGKSIRGERLTEYVVVSAGDGYRVLFSVAEIDSMFREKVILLCYAKDGSPLPDQEGPLRLVIPDEHRHARWVRMVTKIEYGRLP